MIIYKYVWKVYLRRNLWFFPNLIFHISKNNAIGKGSFDIIMAIYGRNRQIINSLFVG